MPMFLRAGSSGAWNTTGKWSNTSGGPSNGTFPSSATDVVIDSNSTGFNLNMMEESTCVCRTLTVTGAASGVLSGYSLEVYGNVTVQNGVNVNMAGLQLTVAASLTLNMPTTQFQSLSFKSYGNTVTLANTLNVVRGVNFGGSLQTNDFSIFTGNFSCEGGGGGVINLGASLIYLMGFGAPGADSTIMHIFDTYTLNAGTSTVEIAAAGMGAGRRKIRLSNGGALYNLRLMHGGSNGGAVWILGPSDGPYTGNWNNITVHPDAPLRFNTGSVVGVQSFTSLGSPSLKVNLDTHNSIGYFTLNSLSGAKYVENAYIRNCTALPTNTWRARNSIDGGGNTGWNFKAANATFFMFM